MLYSFEGQSLRGERHDQNSETVSSLQTFNSTSWSSSSEPGPDNMETKVMSLDSISIYSSRKVLHANKPFHAEG